MAVLSMLLGAMALLVGLTQFFLPSVQPGLDTPAKILDVASARVDLAGAEAVDGVLQLELNASQLAIVTLPDWQFAADLYPYLHIALEDTSADLTVTLLWVSSTNPGESRSYQLENELRSSMWLATLELEGWEGEISSLYLIVTGASGDVVALRDFSLHGPSVLRQMQAIYSDFTAYIPWNRAAMNSHTGVVKVSSFYPVPLMVAFLTLSLITYGIILLVFRSRLVFDWKVIALMFLAGWVVLDLAWQNRLFHQLADTYRTFSGKSTEEKLAIGPDATLYNFVTTVKAQLEPDNARIYVASSDEYTGLRGAYYLYPFNVFWSLRGHELPHYKYLHSGDYIVTIKPTKAQFAPVKKLLTVPGVGTSEVEVVLSAPVGTLYRVR